MIISINSLKSLGERLACSASSPVAEAPSLLTSLPKEINDKDLDYDTNKLYKLKYPDDFQQLKFFKNGKSSQAMVIPIVLDIKDPFSFEAGLAFDVYMADFNIELIVYNAAEAESATEDDPADYATIAH